METKGKVDMELKDLEATLKNIEEARPFHEITVVCFFGFGGMGLTCMRWWESANLFYRRKFLLLLRKFLRRRTNSFLRDAGWYPGTR